MTFCLLGPFKSKFLAAIDSLEMYGNNKQTVEKYLIYNNRILMLFTGAIGFIGTNSQSRSLSTYTKKISIFNDLKILFENNNNISLEYNALKQLVKQEIERYIIKCKRMRKKNAIFNTIMIGCSEDQYKITHFYTDENALVVEREFNPESWYWPESWTTYLYKHNLLTSGHHDVNEIVEAIKSIFNHIYQNGIPTIHVGPPTNIFLLDKCYVTRIF